MTNTLFREKQEAARIRFLKNVVLTISFVQSSWNLGYLTTFFMGNKELAQFIILSSSLFNVLFSDFLGKGKLWTVTPVVSYILFLVLIIEGKWEVFVLHFVYHCIYSSSGGWWKLNSWRMDEFLIMQVFIFKSKS